jgi:hypothetical protein
MKLLSDIVDPRFTKSRTDIEAPRRARPKIDSVLPSRRKLRSDREDPRWQKSRTDKVEPTRLIEKIENVLPRRI